MIEAIWNAILFLACTVGFVTIGGMILIILIIILGERK